MWSIHETFWWKCRNSTSQVFSRPVTPFAIHVPSPAPGEPSYVVQPLLPSRLAPTVKMANQAEPQNNQLICICKPGPDFLLCTPASGTWVSQPLLAPKETVILLRRSANLSPIPKNILKLPFALTPSLPLPPFGLTLARAGDGVRVQRTLGPSSSTFSFFRQGNWGPGREDK